MKTLKKIAVILVVLVVIDFWDSFVLNKIISMPKRLALRK